jgi:hypothetical protein
MKNFDMRDAFYVVGLAAVCVGVGAYDWRLAAIVGGSVLLASVVLPSLRGGSS